ncbi:MAG: hypothetical protein QM679_02095 [Patulibacter sp.]
MLAAIFLVVTSLAGYGVATRALPAAPAIVRIPGGFLLGIVFTSWPTYLIAYALSGHTDHALKIAVVASTLAATAIVVANRRTITRASLRLPRLDALIGGGALLISGWLMHARLHNDDGQLVVSANTWGDTALHVALSRSFSVGGNYPTQYPFFAGEPIHYHFGFDFYAGMLQAGGASTLWAFNLPGTLGFTALILLTYAAARLLFAPAQPARAWRDRSVWTGFVAIALLLTNQSQAWRRYLEHDGHGDLLTALTPSVWWHHQGYLATGPYTRDRIAIFETLNPFLTQTHLIVAFAVVLLLAYAVLWQLHAGEKLNRRLLAGIGVTFGAAFWLNGVVWIAAAIFIGGLLAIWGLAAACRAARQAAAGERRAALRRPAITWVKIGACFAVPALLLGLPQGLWLSDGGAGGGLSLYFGYLVCGSESAGCASTEMNPLSLHDWWAFVEYWWLNEGLFIPLLIAAFFLGTRRDKKIIAAATGVFVWGSLFAVGEDIGGFNHKVFNLWELIGGLFVAFALVELWTIGGRLLRRGGRARAGGLASRVALVCAGWLLIVSGLIDFMTIKNDYAVPVYGDATQQQAMHWIVNETPPRATLLIDYDQMYNAATLGGRRVLLGYSPWAASSGYDIEPRKQAVAAAYSAPDVPTLCHLLRAQHVDYVLVGPQERTSTRFTLNTTLFDELTPAASFGDGDNQYRIFRTASSCA